MSSRFLQVKSDNLAFMRIFEAVAEAREDYRMSKIRRWVELMYPDLSEMERRFVAATFRDILQDRLESYLVRTFE